MDISSKPQEEMEGGKGGANSSGKSCEFEIIGKEVIPKKSDFFITHQINLMNLYKHLRKIWT